MSDYRYSRELHEMWIRPLPRVHRYKMSGQWFKGNTHIHTKASDGAKTPAEIARLYARAKYDFLFVTDHGIASALEKEKTQNAPLMLMDGIELDGLDRGGSQYHVVCLGKFNGISREMDFVTALEAARAQGGFLILAHPFWMGNSMADALRWRFDGVEVYNHTCHWLNGKDNSAAHWDAMLRRFPNTLGLAVDDFHHSRIRSKWNGGWIMVNAPDCTPKSIMAAIRNGNFYSSCGPEIHAIRYRGQKVTIKTSPARAIRIVGPAWFGRAVASEGSKLLHEATFDIPGDWTYAYIEVEDVQGLRAWTNPLEVFPLSRQEKKV